MIKIDLDGTLPKIPEPSSIMQKLALMMAEDIKSDVAMGGSPNAWKQKVFGGQATLPFIARTMQTSFGDNFSEVQWGGMIYAKVHERGMNIAKTPAMRAMMWKHLREQGFRWDGQTRRPNLEVPKRSALQGIFARKEKYMEFIGREITITESVPLFKGATS
jgi:hypothetical protein